MSCGSIWTSSRSFPFISKLSLQEKYDRLDFICLSRLKDNFNGFVGGEGVERLTADDCAIKRSMETHCRRYTTAQRCRSCQIASRCEVLCSPGNKMRQNYYQRSIFRRISFATIKTDHLHRPQCKKHVKTFLIAFNVGWT